jgi:hypothetical protein
MGKENHGEKYRKVEILEINYVLVKLGEWLIKKSRKIQKISSNKLIFCKFR